MSKKSVSLVLSDDVVANKIYCIRGQKVMLDRDLAELFGVETKVLKQAVRRNIARFPEDFMFEMSTIELEDWRSQFVTSNSDRQGLRYLPFCFPEQGVTMISCILNSERAIHVNIQVIRIFTRIRQFMTDNTELRLEVEKIKKLLDNQGKNMEVVFRYLDELLAAKDKPTASRRTIGYKITPKKE